MPRPSHFTSCITVFSTDTNATVTERMILMTLNCSDAIMQRFLLNDSKWPVTVAGSLDPNYVWHSDDGFSRAVCALFSK